MRIWLKKAEVRNNTQLWEISTETHDSILYAGVNKETAVHQYELDKHTSVTEVIDLDTGETRKGKPMAEKYYTPNEVAEMLKVTRRSVYDWIKEDRIDAVKIGSAWRIPESAIANITAFGNMSHLKRIAESMNLFIESKQNPKTRLKGYMLMDSENKIIAGKDYSLSLDELAKALAEYRNTF